MSASQPSKIQILAFASAALPTFAITAIVANYLPAYYSGVSDVTLTQVGMVFFLLRAFDFVSDLGVGFLIDSSSLKLGRYKPWVALAIPVSMTGVYLMYLPDEDSISVTYLIMGGLIMYVGHTLANISHLAWASEVFGANESALNRVFAIREGFAIVGLMLAYLIPALMELNGVQSIGEQVNGVGTFLLFAIPCLLLITLFSMSDGIESDHNAKPCGSFVQTLRALKCRGVVRIVLVMLFLYVSLISIGTLSPFFIRDYLGMSDIYARVQVLFFIAALVCVFPWLYLANRVGEERALYACAVYMPLAHTSIVLTQLLPSAYTVSLYIFLAGSSAGAVPFILKSLAGMEASRIEQESGINVRGVVYGCLALSEKLGGALATLIALSLLELSGFTAANSTTAGAADSVIYIIYALPMVAYAFIFIALTYTRSTAWKLGNL